MADGIEQLRRYANLRNPGDQKVETLPLQPVMISTHRDGARVERSLRQLSTTWSGKTLIRLRARTWASHQVPNNY